MRKAEVINKTTSAIEGIWVSLCSLAKFVMNDGTGLHIQLWGHGSDCATANAITASGQVERSTEKYKKECPDGFL